MILYTIIYHPALDLTPDYFGEETHDYEALDFQDEAKALKSGLIMDRKRLGCVYFQKKDGGEVLRERLSWRAYPKVFVTKTEAFAPIRRLRQLQGASSSALQGEENSYLPSTSVYEDYKTRCFLHRLLKAVDVPHHAKHIQEAFTTIRGMKEDVLEEPWLGQVQKERVIQECGLARQYLDALGVR